MNNVEKMLGSAVDIRQFTKDYCGYLSKLLSKLDFDAIACFAEKIEKARQSGNAIFFIGNGGSAATASHMANDFGLGPVKGSDTQPYKVLSLTDNVAKMTAIANDCGYDKVFIYQLKVHYRPGDKLVAISASGNSPNIIAAAEWVKKQGGTVIGFVGFDGGKLKSLCDIVIHVPTPKGEYGPVEDIHIILGHLIYMWLWHKKPEL